MYYTQMLRIASGLKWLAVILASIYALVAGIAAANGDLSRPHAPVEQGAITLPMLFAIAGLIASIFASRYARTLSEENEGHLPVVWTKPASRERYALTVVGIDILGIVAAFLLAFLTALAFIATFAAVSAIGVPSDSGMQLLRYLALPLGYYGVMTALTASFGKPGRGIIGFTWLASFLVMLFAALDFPQPWNLVFTVLNFVNPIAYAGYTHKSAHDATVIASGPHATVFTSLALSVDLAALLALFVVGLALGIAQWRRVEA